MVSMPVDAFRRLQSSLPEIGSGDIADNARASLRYIVEPIAADAVAISQAQDIDPLTCPNCGCPIELTRSPYCSVLCKESSAFVRQFRAGIVDGTVFDHERQIAFGQNLWFLLGGGRPLRQFLIPPKTRLQVFERSDYKCTLCGAEATEIDHIGTGCNRSINLRAVCEACCRAKPFGDLRVTDTAEFIERREEFAARIGGDAPIKCCDDAASWDWRSYVDQRVALLREFGL